MQIRVTPQGPYVVTGAPAPHRARPIKSADDESLAWEHDAPLDSEGGLRAVPLRRLGQQALLRRHPPDP